MAEPLSMAASIIALIQITNSAVGYLYSVRGASREREAMISEATNLLGLLNGLRFRVESSNSDNEWFNALRGLATENGALDQCKQALELLQEKLAPSHEKRKMKDALGWHFKQNEVDRILERLGRLSSLVNVALEEDHFTLSQAIQYGMLTIGEDTAAIRQSTATLVDDNKLLTGMATGIMVNTAFIADQRSLAIADWLSANDNSKQQADIMARHQSDTGRCFLESDAFREWEQGKYRILLCPGVPGAGKTMMAALAIDHLQKTARNRDSPVVFLYCNYKRSDDQGAVQLVRDILRQLAVHQPPIPKPIQTLYEKNSNSYPPEEAVVDTLEAICSDFADTMLVVDAANNSRGSVSSCIGIGGGDKSKDGCRAASLVCLQEHRVQTKGSNLKAQSNTEKRLIHRAHIIPKDILQTMPHQHVHLYAHCVLQQTPTQMPYFHFHSHKLPPPL
ncbi:hypothetical protein LTR37_017336 [Vermiconidia calcicola]|uniref:Uncharacterized protein n=1 Tax=Vermiconidia calcicola TaxID=1690605 RepID=A0ACC3MLW5_9PEZI|nr:hypothetical protein LTR37_017336 [Vermiconidia calcicola]